MNIFILDRSPKLAAQMQCDKHVPKMLLESAQMLCLAAHESLIPPYKATHINHPCVKWILSTRGNYEWLLEHALEQCNEYTFRFNKRHKSQDVIEWCENSKSNDFESTQLTNFANKRLSDCNFRVV